jgi:ABC-type transport system involved in multi-copper enzyme maturation permease subunit
MTTLLVADLRSRARGLGALAGGSFVLLVALCGSYSAYGGSDAFAKTFGGKTPKLLSAFSGSAAGDIFSPKHYLAFGFGHPLFLVLALSVAITSGVGAVAGDVESGRAEMIFTAPVGRTWVLRTRLSGWLLAQLGVLVAAVCGALLGARLSADLSGISPLVPLRVAVQFFALALFVGSVAFAASAGLRKRGTAMGVAIGITAGSYLANLISLLWGPLGFVGRLNPFGYYEPTAAADSIAWGDVAVLTGGAAVALLLGRYWLVRRDLT